MEAEAEGLHPVRPEAAAGHQRLCSRPGAEVLAIDPWGPGAEALVGPDGVEECAIYNDRGVAEEIADLMNFAYEQGRRSAA